VGPSRAALIDGSLSTYTPGRSGAPPLPSPIGRLLRWARTLRGGGQAANAGIAVVRVTRGMLAQEPRFIVLFRAARKRVAAMEVRFVERSMTPNCVPSSRSMRPGARYLGVQLLRTPIDRAASDTVAAIERLTATLTATAVDSGPT